GNKHGVADEDQAVGLRWLAWRRFTPDPHSRHLDVVQRPSGDGNRSCNPGGIVGRSVETAKRHGWSDARDIYLDLLGRARRAHRVYRYSAGRPRSGGHLKASVSAARRWKDGDVWLIRRYRPVRADAIEKVHGHSLGAGDKRGAKT